MKKGLIGYSGFVGSNLTRQSNFDELYNSKNFQQLGGAEFDLLVCCGVSAVKWLANKEPDNDWQGIAELQRVLAQVKAKQFVLISTVDVYPDLNGVDESFDPSASDNHAYGKHRFQFEQFCQSQFECISILRLPGLFGAGLKKNIIFDLIHSNCLDLINPGSSYQYYCLDDLWRDIERVVASGEPLINLCSAPLQTADIIAALEFTGAVGENKQSLQNYDVRSRCTTLLGGDYVCSSDVILSRIVKFVERERS